MALTELSMLEQRYLAVREVLDTGATVTDVAARHGVDRRTAAPLARPLCQRRDRGPGREELRSPTRCPDDLPPVLEARRSSRCGGASGLGAVDDPQTKLREAEFDTLPSRSADLSLPGPPAADRAQGPRRRQREDYKRWNGLPFHGALADRRRRSGSLSA